MNYLRSDRFRLFVVVVWFIWAPSLLNAQDKVFTKEEVDKPAYPFGGASFFTEFITHNLRPPFYNSVNQVEGRVELKGVIEPDGNMSSLEVVQSLNEASDKESIRVLGLFKAWVPAQKDGKAVRQSFNFSLVFKGDQLEGFDREKGEFLFYFDDKFERVKEGSFRYKLVIPVDENGIPNSVLRFSDVKKKRGAEENLDFLRREVSLPALARLLEVRESELSSYLTTTKAFVVSANNGIMETGMPEYIVDENGRVIRELRHGVFSKVYYASGQLARLTLLERADIAQKVSWYPNSYPKEKYYVQALNDSTSLEKFIYVFDHDGTALVQGGNGVIDKPGFNWGMGTIKSGFLEGVWKLSGPDGTLFEERYEKGRFLGGTYSKDGQIVNYTKYSTSPAYKGEMSELYKFLASTLRYPTEASRAGVQGRVEVAFLIHPDGSVSDVRVKKGRHPDLDAEAVRVVRLTSGQWIPATERGFPVVTEHSLPINFALE